MYLFLFYLSLTHRRTHAFTHFIDLIVLIVMIITIKANISTIDRYICQKHFKRKKDTNCITKSTKSNQKKKKKKKKKM